MYIDYYILSQKNDSEEEENVQETLGDNDKEFLPVSANTQITSTAKMSTFHLNGKIHLFSHLKQGHREGLSEYELERLENIRQNQAFLNSLKLPQVKLCSEAGETFFNNLAFFNIKLALFYALDFMNQYIGACLQISEALRPKPKPSLKGLKK